MGKNIDNCIGHVAGVASASYQAEGGEETQLCSPTTVGLQAMTDSISLSVSDYLGDATVDITITPGAARELGEALVMMAKMYQAKLCNELLAGGE